jgi:hypothetical protein
VGLFNNEVDTGPASDVVDITPNDGTVFAAPLRQIFVTNGGSLKVDTLDQVGRVLAAVPSGFYLTCVVRRVYSTGTTATGLIGFV